MWRSPSGFSDPGDENRGTVVADIGQQLALEGALRVKSKLTNCPLLKAGRLVA
jgi:hypothetical protein